jgi:hypothetical protein
MQVLRNLFLRITAVILGVFFSVAALAQEGGGADVKVDINKGSGDNWYAQPWVWIVGVAVFILLLVALLRGGGRRSAD